METLAEEWVPVPGSPGIERNTVTGRLRTNIPPPPITAPRQRSAPWSPPKGWPRGSAPGTSAGTG